MTLPDLRHFHTKLDPDASSGEFSLRPLDLDDDLNRLHAWMNDPDVARFWKKAWPREHIASYLSRQIDLAHSAPYVGELDGVPMSYWELYRADLDPLAAHYDARPDDVGVHLLLGPPSFRGRGLAGTLLRTVSSWQLAAEPRATRVVGEPDVDNTRSIRTFEGAGFRQARYLDLPDKRAVLMVRPRARD